MKWVIVAVLCGNSVAVPCDRQQVPDLPQFPSEQACRRAIAALDVGGPHPSYECERRAAPHGRPAHLEWAQAF
jgi:hypothetical protein